jgi:hypothetical protein
VQAARVRRRTTRTVKPHPIELALVAGLALLLALRTLLVALLALVLTLTGWRPRADAPIRAQTVQLPQAEPPSATTVAQLRAKARERGLPSRLWRSARKAQLVALLA